MHGGWMDGGGHVGIERAKKSQGESRHCMLLFLQQLLLEQVSAQLFALPSLSRLVPCPTLTLFL